MYSKVFLNESYFMPLWYTLFFAGEITNLWLKPLRWKMFENFLTSRGKKFLLSAPSYLRWNFDELRDEQACQGWWQIEGNRKRFDVVLYGRGIAWIDVNGLKHLAENLSSDSLVDFYKVKSLFQEREIPNFEALFGNNISLLDW